MSGYSRRTSPIMLFALVALSAFAVLFGPAAAAQPAPASQTYRVEFAPGADETTVEGGLIRTTTNTHLVNAQAGQAMRVSIVSAEDNAVFDIYAPSGARIDMAAALPETGDYRIVVGATRGNASYRLHIQVR
ncbi:hypothetical protein ACFXNW_16190 [Nocardia sp. NPDC059180]|uniref:hypothetical protein n=1 Tax=Nocardia sp. NPDC059180 TaxID=3346761 RepID=UPI0036A17095